MTTIIDALADAAVETVDLYKQHMKNGRYTDANECLGAITGITTQVQRIEDNDISVESLLNYNNTFGAKAYSGTDTRSN